MPRNAAPAIGAKTIKVAVPGSWKSARSTPLKPRCKRGLKHNNQFPYTPVYLMTLALDSNLASACATRRRTKTKTVKMATSLPSFFVPGRGLARIGRGGGGGDFNPKYNKRHSSLLISVSCTVYTKQRNCADAMTMCPRPRCSQTFFPGTILLLNNPLVPWTKFTLTDVSRPWTKDRRNLGFPG
jgi:hypothetical protein